MNIWAKHIRPLWHKEEGATAIEFAMVAPVLFLMVFAIVEFSAIMFASSMIENATSAASRYGTTNNDYAGEGLLGTGAGGGEETASSRADFIIKAVKRHTRALLDPSKLDIKTEILGSFQSGGTGSETDLDPARAGGGTGCAGDAVLYIVTYDWNILTPMIGNMFKGGKYELSSSILVNNENFDNCRN